MSTSALTVAAVTQLQNALIGILTNLHLTAPLWPDGVHVQDGDQYDFIIVGAGTAGSVLASRLSEVDCSVLVIEAGGDPPIESIIAGAFALLPRTKYDWNYTAEFDEAFSLGHRNNILDLTAGRLLGGSSSLNHLIYGRGFPHDYNKWAKEVNDEGWNYDNIYKYILKSERLQDPGILASPDRDNHGLDGNIGTTREPHTLIIKKYLDAIKEIGYDVIIDTVPGLNDVQKKLAFSQLLFFIANLERQSTAQGYLSVFNSRNNLNILKNTLVTNIVYNEDKAAEGVIVLTNDGRELTLKANKEVILSAGVFNSPKILMLSGIGPQEDLENLKIPVLANLPVGENFQDHVGVLLIQTMEKLPALPRIPLPQQFPLPGMVGYVTFTQGQEFPDYEALNFVFENEVVFSLICSIIFSYDDTVCDSIIAQTVGHEFYASLPSFLHPKSRGKVQLASTDFADKPIINAGYYSVESDVDSMIQIIEDNVKIQNTKIFESLGAKLVNVTLPGCKDYTFQSREYWACYIKYMSTSHFYYTSTCSMGAVVDGNLNVYGVNNLRVVDASVIPFAMSSNPEVGVIVVAERAADLIKAKYYPTPNILDVSLFNG